MKNIIRYLSTLLIALTFSASANEFYITSVFLRNGHTLGPQAFNLAEQENREFALNDAESIRYTLYKEDEDSVSIAVTLIEKDPQMQSNFNEFYFPTMTMLPSGEVNGIEFQAADQAPYFNWKISAAPTLQVAFYKQAVNSESSNKNRLVFKNKQQLIYFDATPVIAQYDIDFTRFRNDDPTTLDIQLNDSGSKKLQEHTRRHIGQWLAIAVKGEIINAAVIRSEISGKIQLALPKSLRHVSSKY